MTAVININDQRYDAYARMLRHMFYMPFSLTTCLEIACVTAEILTFMEQAAEWNSGNASSTSAAQPRTYYLSASSDTPGCMCSVAPVTRHLTNYF